MIINAGVKIRQRITMRQAFRLPQKLIRRQPSEYFARRLPQHLRIAAD
jgi:hypothetical protein